MPAEVASSIDDFRHGSPVESLSVDETLHDSSEQQAVADYQRAATVAIRWDYVIFFTLLHVMALLVFVPYFFTWQGIVAFCLGVIVFGQLAIPIGYHRLLAHKSFQCPKWFERTLVTLAMCTAQETPAQWVAWHRRHHVHSDQPDDPHTPRVNFLWAHINWLIFEKRNRLQTFSMFEKYARDILSDGYYRWIERLPSPAGIFFLAHATVLWVLTSVIAYFVYGPTAEMVRVVSSVMLWGVIARTVWVWHITWSVNSLSHVFGYRNHETSDDSRNNWLVSLLTAGEGWHNNHHADPASASVQNRWWEFDPNYYAIRVFGMLGLASNIIPPRSKRRATGSTAQQA